MRRLIGERGDCDSSIGSQCREEGSIDCTNYKMNYAAFARLPLPPAVWDTPEWSEWMEHRHACRECIDWTMAKRIMDRGYDPDDYPCVHIADQVTKACPDHTEAADCSDILISYFAKFDEYSIAARDGSTSSVAIRYCPWCGIALPESKRDRWFKELTTLGYTDFYGDDIPPEYLTNAWYKNAK